MIPQNDKVFILSAVRTPIGSLNGCLSSLKAHELGSLVIKESLIKASISPEDVNEVVLGQVLTAGQGQNPARQASVGAGIPYAVPSMSLNMVCGSGLRSVVTGYQSIKCGDASIVVCGGQESMSQAPHLTSIRTGKKMGPTTLEDSMIFDGLTDAFNNYHMGITAENLAKKWNISREDQDVFALRSQLKVEKAKMSEYFKEEILPVSIQIRKSTTLVADDEFPRPGSSIENFKKLKPCFILDGTGTVTPGNSSGINDGAAAVILASESEVKKRNLKPLAFVVAWAQSAVDPALMGYGPVPAVKSALSKANWTVDEVDLWEVNEAFSAQALVVIRELGLDEEKVNVQGGSIALGHPIGASGTRILVTLLHSLRRLNKTKGVACLCIGGGMGIALCVEAL